MKRKELLSPILKKNLSIRGKIRLLGFFRKHQYRRKRPFIALHSVHGFNNEAIYDRDTLIGFASRGWDTFQGKGHGKNALKLVLDDMIEEYDCSEIYLSVIHDNEAAIRVYEAL